MDDTTTTVVSSVAGGGVITWLLQRVLNSPEKANDKIAALAEKLAELDKRTIRVESRVGSEGDVGTIMHVLTEMQQTQRETQSMLR
jgi:hypothetical protein